MYSIILVLPDSKVVTRAANNLNICGKLMDDNKLYYNYCNLYHHQEMLKLIDVWGDDTIQAHLQDCTRNQIIFERVARELNEAGYDRTFQQCRDKI